VLDPAYTAVKEYELAVENEVDNVATPELRLALPREVDPW
jgi:hypothetical protein